MTGRSTRLIPAVLLGLVLTAGAACKKTPVTPSPVEAIDTFTGTISPGGRSSHGFSVSYTYAYTDAYFTVTNLTSVADGSAKNITIGVGYGAINVGVCTRYVEFTNPAAPFNQEIGTTNVPFGPGGYCIQVFDNPDAPTVTEPLNYTLKVRHY